MFKFLARRRAMKDWWAAKVKYDFAVRRGDTRSQHAAMMALRAAMRARLLAGC